MKESEPEVVSSDHSPVGDTLVGALPPDVEVETGTGMQASSSQTMFEATSDSSQSVLMESVSKSRTGTCPVTQ